MEERFLKILPKVQLHGRIFFRHIKCRESREEAIAEMVALAWRWFVRLAQRGKDANEFVFNFCRFAAFAVKSGRRLSGHEKSKDVLSPRAQRELGFKVESLPVSPRTSHGNLFSAVHGQQQQDAFEERLRDNMQTPVPEQAAFRIDWPAWVRTYSRRDRQIIRDLMAGDRTLDVSRKYGISPGRVSQLRQQFHDDWQRFNGEAEPQLAAA